MPDGRFTPTVCCGSTQLGGPGCCPPNTICVNQGDHLECMLCAEGTTQCGNICCTANEVCVDPTTSSCVACSPGSTFCPQTGDCRDLQNDNGNCGSCGHDCGPSLKCVQGV